MDSLNGYVFRYASLVLALCLISAAPASDIKFFDPPGFGLALWAKDVGGVVEPPVPILHSVQGGAAELIGGHNHQLVDAFDGVPGGAGFPLTMTDIVANSFLRLSPQSADGSSASLGTSIVRSPSFRVTPDQLQLIPQSNVSGTVFTRDVDRYRSVISGEFFRSGSMDAEIEITWDGAPGVVLGNPPPGDGVFDQKDIVAALGAGVYLTGAYAAIQPNGQKGDDRASIIYNATTGEMAVDPPAGREFTSVNIDSPAEIFVNNSQCSWRPVGGAPAGDECDYVRNLFAATFIGSFGSFSFGEVAERGLTEEFLLRDLTVIGSLAGGGELGDVDLIYVPEPSCVILLVVGFLALGAYGSRKSDIGRSRGVVRLTQAILREVCGVVSGDLELNLRTKRLGGRRSGGMRWSSTMPATCILLTTRRG